MSVRGGKGHGVGGEYGGKYRWKESGGGGGGREMLRMVGQCQMLTPGNGAELVGVCGMDGVLHAWRGVWRMKRYPFAGWLHCIARTVVWLDRDAIHMTVLVLVFYTSQM